MTDVKFLLLHGNSYNNLTVSKQMSKSKWNDLCCLNIYAKGELLPILN